MTTDSGVTHATEAARHDELRSVAGELAKRFPQVSAERVQTMVNRAADRMRQGAKITEFIPVLVQHEVTDQLTHQS